MSQPDKEAQLQAVLRMLSELDQASDVPRCVALCRQALTLISRDQDPTLWAELQSKLGNSLIQTPQGERANNLERAIHHYEQALEVQTRETLPEQWAATQHNLAFAYQNRIRGARADNLEQAIHYHQKALQVYTRENFPTNWATTQGSLALALSERIRGERAEDLEQAIHCFKHVLQVYTRKTFPAAWAATQNNLALAYSKRIRGERADNLEQAIHHYQQALQVYTRAALPADWAVTQYNLANTYFDRIQGERAENLECAIHHYQQALEVRTRESVPEQWAKTQNNLATAYAKRIRGERAENLEQAIHHYKQALKVRTREAFPKEWAETQNNLANAFFDRIRGERADNLEQAIHHYQQSLRIYARNAFPEQWAGIQNNLATAYLDRIRGERADNLEQAVHHCEQALKVRTREALPEQWATSQNNLAAAYADRIRGERADNLERAIHHYEQALKVRTREAFPAECRRTQRNLGRLQLDRNNWALAHAAYAEAIKAGALLLAEAYTEAGRRAEVGEVSHLFANDAYCLLRLKRPAEALARMEEGKTRLLNEALALAEVDLALLPDADQQATQAARRAIRELEAEMRLPPDTPARRSDRELAEALREARADLNRLIETIRAARPEFLPVGLDLPELLALIPEGGALVAPFFAAKGSAVFVLPHGRRAVTEDDVVRLAQLTDADLQAVLRGSADEPGLGGWLGAYVDHKANPQSWQDAIGTTGRALWDSLMGPVHERLSALGLAEAAPVLLMPQGGLGLLPLHAAWREVGGERRHFIDDWTVSYAPSGYALSVSRRRLEEERRHGRTLLAVIDPTGDLPFTPAEGEAVAALFEPGARDALPGDRATRERVVAMAHGRAYLHLSCHGFYHWLEPMRSGVVLAGGEPLTLAEVIAPGFDLGAARLVVLSACETGLTDIRQSPDEYLGLPAGFLQAGAPTVVSTLWPVEDLSTMLLMERFYRGHLQEGLPPAVALRRSQLWLRDATAGDLNLAERWAEVYRTTTGSEARRRAFAAMRYFMRHPEDRPFASSYYWAPFTLTGA